MHWAICLKISAQQCIRNTARRAYRLHAVSFVAYGFWFCERTEAASVIVSEGDSFPPFDKALPAIAEGFFPLSRGVDVLLGGFPPVFLAIVCYLSKAVRVLTMAHERPKKPTVTTAVSPRGGCTKETRIRRSKDLSGSILSYQILALPTIELRRLSPFSENIFGSDFCVLTSIFLSRVDPTTGGKP